MSTATTSVPAEVLADNIGAFVEPRSIAIVGASSDPGRLGGRSLAYLKRSYAGPVYPVNPRRAEVQGLRSYASLSDLPSPPDLVLVLVSAADAVAAVEEAATVGVRAAIVFSSGFAETGPAGAELQARLTAVSRSTGMRILGPNTNGLVAVPTGIWTTFATLPEPLAQGPLAIVSQSGAFALNVFLMAKEEGYPVNYFCGTGNEADLTVAEMLEYFVERPDVNVLVAYAEMISDAPRLLRVGDRARELDKPLLFIKAGRSTSGERAARSHTGSIAGSDAAVDAAFAQHGILRPRSVEQALNWVTAFSSRKRPRGRRVGILTASGGMGIMLADAAEAAGLVVPELSSGTQAEIRSTVPDFAATSNPVDVTGQVVNDPELLSRVLDRLSDSPDLDLLVIPGLGGRGEPDEIARAVAAADASDKPYLVWRVDSAVVRRLREVGIPAYRDSTVTMDAAAALIRYSTFQWSTPAVPPGNASTIDAVPSRNGFVLEHDARHFLGAYGVPQLDERAVDDRESAITAAEAIGYPVVLKAVSYDYVHKSEAGAVAVGLADSEALADAYDRMERRVASQGYSIATFLVQALAPSGIEMIVGVRRDDRFGPIVSVGLGGTLVEILAQVASRPAPLSELDGHEALRELCGGRLVSLSRGLTPTQADQLVKLMVAAGQAAMASDSIAEIDLNPVVVAADGLYVVDAAITLSKEQAP